MYTTVLFMVTYFDLIDEIGKLVADGKEINCVTPLREFREPNMDGVVVTDWLIIYKRARE